MIRSCATLSRSLSLYKIGREKTGGVAMNLHKLSRTRLIARYPSAVANNVAITVTRAHKSENPREQFNALALSLCENPTRFPVVGSRIRAHDVVKLPLALAANTDGGSRVERWDAFHTLFDV